MDWDTQLVPYLSTVIVVATVATVVLAVFSYLAFKLRERRRPRSAAPPVFFHRYRPDGAPAAEPDAEAQP